jgi:acyl-CoA synthetase (NDP forming)/RimJ/RimL family protein N-acetyltransferase
MIAGKGAGNRGDSLGRVEPEPPYPAHWEADVVLRDGSTTHLRPIRRDDADRLQRFYARLSPETIYFRFFAPYPRLSERDLQRFTSVDHVDRVAFIATVGEEMLGVVRYDRVEPDHAEVAFNIEDAHQGRGLGSVFLEHIAAAARERGIRRFTADVLPANRKMLTVFREAGYIVGSQFDDGVVALTFDIAETETSRAVMAAREHRAEARSIERLLAPSAVAVVGASRDSDSVGQTVLRNLVATGFTGTLNAVNPHAREVAGVPAYPTLAAVPGPVDLAVVAVPAAAVEQVVADCGRKGVQGLVVISAGYAETGPEGRERQRRLVTTARANGMRVVGPNSFGMINAHPDVRLNASLSPVVPDLGRVGFFSQSGALGIAILEAVTQRGLGLSSFVSAGNRADVSGNDLMQFWEEDPDTDVILLYLESIGNPRKFSRLARRITRRKPIVAVKSGGTAPGASQGAPLGHAVRSSNAPPEAVDALFRQAGVIRVEGVSQLFDVAQVLATQPLPVGDRVAVVGNSDALGVLASDAVLDRGLRLAGDPVSLGAEASAEDFSLALARIFADEDVDAVVAVFIPPLRTGAEDVAQVLQEAARATPKTVVSTFLGMGGVPEQLRSGQREAVPSYPSPEEAVRALAAVMQYAAWRDRPAGRVPELGDVDSEAARRLVERALAAQPDGTALGGVALGDLLRHYGIEVWPVVPVAEVHDAVRAAVDVGYPVALKTTAPHLRHRTDLGGVRLHIADETELRAAYAGMAAQLGAEVSRHFVVQRMAPTGVATVLGSMEDPLFGPIVSFGLAGVATELLADRAFRIPPLSDGEVAELVRSVRAAPLLFGHRGAEPADVAALEDLLGRVSRLADDLPEVAALELNPVVVAPRGLAVLHASVRLDLPRARADRGARALPGTG